MTLFPEAKGKYGNIRTWSELCQRKFASKAAAVRGEELAMLEKAGEIQDLRYQPQFPLTSEGAKPSVKYIADFSYWTVQADGYHLAQTVEDVKGKDTPNSRTKRAWLKQKYGIDVKLVRKRDDHA